MSINGKREKIERDDLIQLGKLAGIKERKCNEMIDRVIGSFEKWPELAEKNCVPDDQISKIEKVLLLDL